MAESMAKDPATDISAATNDRGGPCLFTVGSTKMACEQPLMDQEFVFLQILGAVSRFEFDTEGKLVLHSDDGTLVASRK
jgi:heat shock protein HslJ